MRCKKITKLNFSIFYAFRGWEKETKDIARFRRNAIRHTVYWILSRMSLGPEMGIGKKTYMFNALKAAWNIKVYFKAFSVNFLFHK